MHQSDVRIVLRPLGSPLTIGMSGLTIASLVQSGLDLGWIAPTQARQVGLILLAVAFVLQLIACVFSYLARDGATGAAVGVLATVWGGIGAIHLTSSPGSRSGAAGLLLLAAGGVLVRSSLALSLAKPLPGVVFATAGLRFALAGVYQLGATTAWKDAAGVVGLGVVALASYCVIAFELEDQQRRPVLPTFRRRRAAAAMHGGLDEQLDDLPHEAGVRQTT